MYDRFTDPNGHNLTNLIWVWNGQNKDWFPGADYCDIVGVDIYAPEREYGSLMNHYYRLVEESMEAGTMKIIALTETGVIPDIGNMLNDKSLWNYWMTWNGEFVVNGANLSSRYTEEKQVIKMYESEYVITLDKLPDLKTYPIEGKN
jgi:mannan endo-1,4-beta-mannosidase